MNTLPNLTESDLNDRTTDSTWDRARDYHEGGWVDNLVWRKNMLTAEVEGSSDEPYQVSITFTDDILVSTYCTCPYDFTGDCKHIIATLLTLIHQPDKISTREPFAKILAPLSQQQLITLITEMAQTYPQIGNEIESYLPMAKTSVEQTEVKAVEAQISDAELKLLHRQIKAEIRSATNSGDGYWDDDYWEDVDLGAALEPGLSQVAGHLEAGHTQPAFLLLDVICDAWQDGIDSLDEDYLDAFIDFDSEFTFELGKAWAKTILMADLDESKRMAWAEQLDELSESMFGGESLEIAVTAAHDGWDYPPLRAAMEGNITTTGAWADEVPYFSEDLAVIRLEVLAQRGDYDAYLNLAQAEGQFMLYLHMLVKQGQSDKAMAEAEECLRQPSQIHALCITLAEQGHTEDAIQLAQYGLQQEEAQGKSELATWLSELANREKLPDLALSAAREALIYTTTLTHYLAVQTLNGDGWADIKPTVLKQVAESPPMEGVIDIYLHEGMNDEATAIFDQHPIYLYTNKIIEAVKVSHPKWAFAKCRKEADSIMDAKRSQEYKTAVEWVRRGRDILVAAGLNQEWRSYISHLQGIHERKYKLMPMLKRLA